MSKLYTFLKYFFIVFWAVFVVAPFLWALTTSFKDFQSVNGGVTYIPWVDFEPNLEGWKVLIKSPAKGGVDIVEPYFNSLFVTCTASLISIILGTLSAYALSRYTFKAGFVKNNDITFFFISQRIMPPIVLSIPFFLFLSSINLLDSLIGLIVVYIVLLMPIAVWIMVDFFNKVPREIDETALIDGCNPYQAFLKVVLPNSIPGLIVAGMFCIIFGWIDFFFAFILTFTEVQLLPVKIVALNSSVTPWDAGMRELNSTGFMHNRVRMITASFLCKHLLIDWRKGEKYFASKLFDYEQASNVGNWPPSLKSKK